MARPDGLYSRIIAWLKILLPLAALAMLSTLFLFATDRADLPDVPFADALGSGETAREQVSAPYYSGTTDRGDVLTMTALTVIPDTDDRIRADTLSATLSFKDGSHIALNAGSAMISNQTRAAELGEGVRIDSSTGYTLTTEALTASLDRTEAESRGPVSGSSPAGTLEAGRMRIVPQGENGDVQLLFTEGVKLIYEPQKD
ncbi:LPS export ABC transporter periplasmic protein LptC [Cognatishimia sp. F0-27]|uniref:LPS export ABC transporter periplasmic protein LptC n=1 Tax=Cognatishimia sp. F0-27 TaxID=2816855 RepID=UPI001D0C5D33|nr:LPS export ABC transporter periplasmic protein LptC [Cognatishimia sp. F0-27]MCC1491295.1 LPS export ABC transporter periplasmic protein LptC [Cognatishimia sp. F0-27]